MQIRLAPRLVFWREQHVPAVLVQVAEAEGDVAKPNDRPIHIMSEAVHESFMRGREAVNSAPMPVRRLPDDFRVFGFQSQEREDDVDARQSCERNWRKRIVTLGLFAACTMASLKVG